MRTRTYSWCVSEEREARGRNPLVSPCGVMRFSNNLPPIPAGLTFRNRLLGDQIYQSTEQWSSRSCVQQLTLDETRDFRSVLLY